MALASANRTGPLIALASAALFGASTPLAKLLLGHRVDARLPGRRAPRIGRRGRGWQAS